MSYYINRIDEKLVGRRRTSKLKKQLAATQKELANTKIYHSAAQDQIKKLNRQEDKNSPSNKPRERSYIAFHTSNRDDLGGKTRKMKSGEVSPVRNYSVGDNSKLRKADATVRGSNTQVATGKGSKAMRRMANNVSPREIYMKTIRRNLPQDIWGFTEAVYNSYVDLAYLIETKLRKTRPGEPATRVRGKFYRTDSPAGIGYRRSETGELERYRLDKSREGLRSQEGYSNRPVSQRVAKHYRKLHKKANAGDKKAKELLRRAEMSGND